MKKHWIIKIYYLEIIIKISKITFNILWQNYIKSYYQNNKMYYLPEINNTKTKNKINVPARYIYKKIIHNKTLMLKKITHTKRQNLYFSFFFFGGGGVYPRVPWMASRIFWRSYQLVYLISLSLLLTILFTNILTI